MLFDPADPHSRLPALYRACVMDHAAMVHLLLEHGADPDDGESVYHAAELDARRSLALLRQYGADLSARHPRWGNTPLFFLAGHGGDDGHARRTRRGMSWLLEHGADPNVTSYASAETPLHALAGGGGHPATIELLIRNGADPDAARADGRTPLALARRVGDEAAAAALVRGGAREPALGPVDRLLAACFAGDEARARATLAGEPALIERADDDDREAVGRAAAAGRARGLELLAALGFDLASEGTGAGTPLHRAAWHGRVEAARALVAAGVPVDARDRDYGVSPLGWAAHGSRFCRAADADYVAVIEILIAAGATPGAAVNRWGESPDTLASTVVAAHLSARGFAIPGGGTAGPAPAPRDARTIPVPDPGPGL